MPAPYEFSIILNLRNAAFRPDPGPEIVSVLRKLADRFERGEIAPVGMAMSILDANGNHSGSFTYSLYRSYDQDQA